ncbi:terminase large subunit [Salmonella phage 19]|nr:terminase large subunit [Salmonella phage 19]
MAEAWCKLHGVEVQVTLVSELPVEHSCRKVMVLSIPFFA